MEDFYRSIHMPTNIRGLGYELTEEQVRELAYKCTYMETRTVGNFKKLGKKELEEIYRSAV